jgi:hypothetical protein
VNRAHLKTCMPLYCEAARLSDELDGAATDYGPIFAHTQGAGIGPEARRREAVFREGTVPRRRAVRCCAPEARRSSAGNGLDAPRALSIAFARAVGWRFETDSLI